MNIGSIFVSLGIKADTKTLNTFNNNIKSTVKGLTGVGLALSGAVYGMKKFVESGNLAASSIVNFNRQTGLSVDKLNQFKAAGQALSSNFDVENITTDILNLEKSLARIRIGQGSYKPFQMLGIDVIGKDAFGVLEQLRNNIRGIGDATATVLLEDLGLNPNFLQILKLSNTEFDKLSKNNFLKLGQAKTIDNLNLKMRGLSQAFINLKNQAIVKIAPVLTDLINKTFKWMAQNGAKITNVITSIAKGFGDFITAIARAGSLVTDFVSKIAGVDNSLKILAGAFAFATLAGRPLLLGLTALLLILEDIAVWKMGGKSLFGDLYTQIAKIPNIDKIIGGGVALLFVGKLIGGFKGLFGILNNVYIKLAAIAAIFYNLREIGDWIENLFGGGEKGKIAKGIGEIGLGAGAGFALGGVPGAVAGGTFAALPYLQKLGELNKETQEKSYGLFGKMYRGRENYNNSNQTNTMNLTIQNNAGGSTEDFTEKVTNAVKNTWADLIKPTINNMNNIY